jgi:hypothetical protein
VVVVKKPRNVKFATILSDVREPVQDRKVEVLFLEEIQAVDFAVSNTACGDITSREVHYLTHVSKKPANIRLDQLVFTEGRFHVVEWEDRDIWDHMADGTFRNITVVEYMQQRAPGKAPPGVRNTLFLLDKAIFKRYRDAAGYETRDVQKRSLLWPTNPIDERSPKKTKK